MMIDVLNFGSFHFLVIVFCAYIVITPQSFNELSLALTFSYYWLQFLIGVIWAFISNSGHFYICFRFQLFLHRSFMDLLVFAYRAILAYHFTSVFLWWTVFCFYFSFFFIFKTVWWSYSYYGMTGRKSMASGTSICHGK